MAIWLTEHTSERAAQRGVSEDEIFDALSDPGRVFKESKRDKFRWLITGKSGEKFITVVFNRLTECVVTVYEANKKERKRYDRQKRI